MQCRPYLKLLLIAGSQWGVLIQAAKVRPAAVAGSCCHFNDVLRKNLPISSGTNLAMRATWAR
jgi:hypothetical protein